MIITDILKAFEKIPVHSKYLSKEEVKINFLNLILGL